MASKMNKDLLDKIQKSTENLSEKIDFLYTLESVIQQMEWVYHSSCVFDENGDCVKDEDGNFVYEKSDDSFNKILDDMIQYAVKKYS